MCAAGSPAIVAGEAAQPWIERKIDDRKDYGQKEEPHPPARQWVVVFGKIAVPHVPVQLGLFSARRSSRAHRPQQRNAGDYADDAYRRNKDAPKSAIEVAHRWSPASRCE